MCNLLQHHKIYKLVLGKLPTINSEELEEISPISGVITYIPIINIVGMLQKPHTSPWDHTHCVRVRPMSCSSYTKEPSHVRGIITRPSRYLASLGKPVPST